MATYTFLPPSREEAPVAWYPEMLQRYRWPRGDSLYLQGGVFKRMRVVHEEIWRNGTEGVDWFKGGYIYRGITQDVADVLISSGFGDGLTEE